MQVQLLIECPACYCNFRLYTRCSDVQPVFFLQAAVKPWPLGTLYTCEQPSAQPLHLANVMFHSVPSLTELHQHLQVFMAGVTDLAVDMVISMPHTIQSRLTSPAQQ